MEKLEKEVEHRNTVSIEEAKCLVERYKKKHYAFCPYLGGYIISEIVAFYLPKI